MADRVADRWRGCLLGLAVGDAVGTAVEFMPPGSFPPVQDMQGGGKFSLLPGQWTDDTSMALCLAESLVECRGFNPINQCKRYWLWYQEGHLSSTGECFDIGKTTRLALNKFQRSSETDPFPGPTSEKAAGNGCLMRLSPMPLCYYGHPERAMMLSGLSARVTHGAQAAVDACRYYTGLIIGCLQGVDKDKLLSPRFSPVPGYWDNHPMVPEVDEVACGSFKEKMPPNIRSSGYVVLSMEAALWAFYHTSSFKEGCLKAVNLGDDADTVGAIYGELAGAYYGADSMPEEWIHSCFFSPLIKTFAEELLELSKVIEIPQQLCSNDVDSIDWNSLSSPVPSDQLSHNYQSIKLTGYECLETGHRQIIRKLNPGPHQYKSLESLDKDIEVLLTKYADLPADAQNQQLVSDYQRIWQHRRERLELVLNRFSRK